VLKNTFCHLPGIGTVTERRVWGSGIHAWADVPGSGRSFSKEQSSLLRRSREALERGDPGFFAGLLPSNQHWRIFRDFRKSMVYLDIETTGLDSGWDHITTIALYDGRRIRHYVRGENLEDFRRDIERYKVLVTYNGKTFDVPFIRRYLDIELDHVHIDLRYLLKRLGYSGGLKSCERQLGFDRGDLASVDGYTAVLLWRHFSKTRDRKALETLLAYNIEDVLSLENLLIFVFNENLKPIPFGRDLRIPACRQPPNPFKADTGILEIMTRYLP